MNEFTKLSVITASLLCIGITTNAGAQGLKEKVIGAWTLNDGSEIFQDGKKVTPWAAGNLILDPTGQFSFFVLGKDRAKGSDDVRIPNGPLVAYYGTYTVNDAENMLIYKV
ncbi:MAG: Lipocalin-like domain, partial [Acidobacteriaceae bacterium]|nr:Lipocalin-like domain [Acidobacteriaceae bacterium]